MDVKFNSVFDISKYGGKLFEVKPAGLSLTINGGPDPLTDGGRQIQAMVQKGFQAEMAKYIAKEESTYKSVLKDLDAKLYKSAAAEKAKITDAAKWLGEQVKGAQVMISNAIKTFKSVLEKKAEEFYLKAATVIDKKFNTELRNMRIKAVLSIARDVTIVVAAAGVAILASGAGVAATATTAGAASPGFLVLAPVAFGALVTAGKAGFNIYKSIKTNWPTHKKALSALEDAVSDLADAVKYEQGKIDKQKGGEKLNKKEQIQILMKNTKGKVDQVKKAKTVVTTWQGKMWQDEEKFAQQLVTMKNQAADIMSKNPPPKVAADAKNLIDKANKADQLFKKSSRYSDDIKAALTDVDKLVASGEALADAHKFSGVLAKLNAIKNNDTVQKISEAAPEIFGNGKDLADKIGDIVKNVK